jgi:hypothetical protein
MNWRHRAGAFFVVETDFLDVQGEFNLDTAHGGWTWRKKNAQKRQMNVL